MKLELAVEPRHTWSSLRPNVLHSFEIKPNKTLRYLIDLEKNACSDVFFSVAKM